MQWKCKKNTVSGRICTKCTDFAANKQKNRLHSETVFWMRMSGLEPMTPCMSSRYSNQLSYTLTTETIIAHSSGFVNPYFKKISVRDKKQTAAEQPAHIPAPATLFLPSYCCSMALTGHASAQQPHCRHSSCCITALPPSSVMQPFGHASAQVPQPIQFSVTT